MLSKPIVDKLNEQLNLEFYSSNLYLQMSAWCAQQGFEGASQFLFSHASEEMMHMHKLFAYLNDTGAMAIIGQVDAPQHEFTSLKEVFEVTYQHEQHITKKINELVAVTFEQKDFSAFNFLQWYVSEQHEEEKLFHGILDKFKLLGDSTSALYHLDNELAKMAQTSMPASTQGNA